MQTQYIYLAKDASQSSHRDLMNTTGTNFFVQQAIDRAMENIGTRAIPGSTRERRQSTGENHRTKLWRESQALASLVGHARARLNVKPALGSAVTGF